MDEIPPQAVSGTRCLSTCIPGTKTGTFLHTHNAHWGNCFGDTDFILCNTRPTDFIIFCQFWSTMNLLHVSLCLLLFLTGCNAATGRRSRDLDAAAKRAENGYSKFQSARQSLRKGNIKNSKALFRQALISDDLVSGIDINSAIELVVDDYTKAGLIEVGYTLVAELMKVAGNVEDARHLVALALQANPNYPDAAILKAELVEHDVDLYALIMRMQPDLQVAISNGLDDPGILSRAGALYSTCLIWDTAEILYSLSYELDPSDQNLKSFASAVFMRNHVCKWGVNGSLYEQDFKRVSDIIKKEVKTTFRQEGIKQASSFTPANVLGYPISPVLKLAVAQSFSKAELAMVVTNTNIKPLDHSTPAMIKRTRQASKEKGFRIRVGYVSANIKSRTTTFMAQNVLMSHDKNKFEIHIYATTPRDSDDLLYNRMRGVDWRNKIRNSVEYFHETHTMDTGQLFRLIREHDIHILLNWDGYSNAGIRAAGIFALTPAPIQMNHQAYIHCHCIVLRKC